MELEDPIESPFCFVEHVRNAVRFFGANCIDFVGKLSFLELVCQKHSRRCVTRRYQIFELIARIMPSASHINDGSVSHRPIKCLAVLLMAICAKIRVIAATLLTHEE